MKNPLAFVDAVVTYLFSCGVGTPGVDLFSLHAPPTKAPKNMSVVYHTGGIRPIGNPTRQPTISIQVRNTHVNSGLSKVTEINSMLDEAWNTLDGYAGRFVLQSEPGPYAVDETGLYVFPLSYVFYTGTQT